MITFFRSFRLHCARVPVAAVLALLVAPGNLAAAPTDSVFTSSNLPIVVIDTRGQTIVDDPKITADMGIIDNGEGVRNYLTDAFNGYDGQIGIEIRARRLSNFPRSSTAWKRGTRRARIWTWRCWASPRRATGSCPLPTATSR